MVRLGLKSIFEELEPGKHEYLEASNGLELIEKAVHSPDIAFVDIQMPQMDGLDAIEEARVISPSTKWFLLTGYSEFQYAQRALRMGISDYLLKPVGLQDILQVMQKVSSLKSNGNLVKRYLKAVTDMDFDVSSPQSMARKIQSVTDMGVSGEIRADIVSRAKAYIQSRYKEYIGVNSIADHLGITPNYLSRLFREQTGMRMTDYLSRMRINKAKTLLVSSGMTVKSIAEKVGYYSAKHFTKVFIKIEGMTPSEYQRKAEEEKQNNQE